MKKILLLFILFNSFLVTLVGTLIYLAEAHPLRPGDLFYPVQQQAEPTGRVFASAFVVVGERGLRQPG